MKPPLSVLWQIYSTCASSAISDRATLLLESNNLPPIAITGVNITACWLSSIGRGAKSRIALNAEAGV
ncbi:MAG TPA: hypothetical protein PLR63_01485 [Paludibacteraceae bacterium]|nr:hypothetical protein [Paludibacteraceae bacterium]